MQRVAPRPLYCPTSQAAHGVSADLSVSANPGLQLVHDVDTAAEKVPALQSSHVEFGLLSWSYLPFAQSIQPFIFDWKVPALHAVPLHGVEGFLSWSKYPNGHWLHFTEPAGEYVPISQAIHSVADEGDLLSASWSCLPAAQGMQLVDAFPEYFPAQQTLHTVAGSESRSAQPLTQSMQPTTPADLSVNDPGLA